MVDGSGYRCGGACRGAGPWCRAVCPRPWLLCRAVCPRPWLLFVVVTVGFRSRGGGHRHGFVTSSHWTFPRPRSGNRTAVRRYRGGRTRHRGGGPSVPVAAVGVRPRRRAIVPCRSHTPRSDSRTEVRRPRPRRRRGSSRPGRPIRFPGGYLFSRRESRRLPLSFTHKSQECSSYPSAQVCTVLILKDIST